MEIFKLYLFILYVALCTTEDQPKKSCPSFGNLPALDDFIEDHFTGLWYQQLMHPSDEMIEKQQKPWLDTTFEFVSETDKIVGYPVLRLKADIDCVNLPPVEMWRIVPGKYSWSNSQYQNRTMTVLGIDYSDYVFFFVCNNPTEDDQCESMQAHGLTRERIPNSEVMRSLEKAEKKLLKEICFPKQRMEQVHITKQENDLKFSCY